MVPQPLHMTVTPLMDESKIRFLLETFPGSRRAAQGVIVNNPDGSVLHVTDFHQVPDDLYPEEGGLLSYCAKNEIIRLRELRTVHDYLLRLRVSAIENSPRAVRVMIARKQQYEE